MSRSLRCLASLLAFLAGFWTDIAVAQRSTADRGPSAAFSVADNPKFEEDRGGPKFKLMKSVIDAANSGKGSMFAKHLRKNAKLQLITFVDGNMQILPFGPRTIRAASKSCVGPFTFAEGASWLQLSWICRVDKGTPLSSFVTFRENPELALTVFFDGNLIKEIHAGEPVPFPGAQRFKMDAASMFETK